ncbi:uncharacterized protein [Centruroides vittatus]|uniref:uncharacterized protein n=1 Tax=Centruroides vittatus TaxID=120091 RepID=UPI00350F26F1
MDIRVHIILKLLVFLGLFRVCSLKGVVGRGVALSGTVLRGSAVRPRPGGPNLWGGIFIGSGSRYGSEILVIVFWIATIAVVFIFTALIAVCYKIICRYKGRKVQVNDITK